MPELPEVETIRRDLECTLIGDAIVETEVKDSRLMSKDRVAAWQLAVHDQPVMAFSRRGKFLMILLKNKSTIIFHLRMTGQLVLMKKEPDMAWRLRLRFKSGQQLFFCDQRRFGEVWVLPPGKSWHNQHLPGPDALNELTQEMFVGIIRSRTTKIHPLLMDQKLLSGVGNIYSQEALFKAAIRPSRSGKKISLKEATLLFSTLRETLVAAIEHRGSTSRNYRDAYGREGSAQDLHAVYRKGGKPCPRCQKPLQASRVGGRGAVYCRQCQR